MKVNAPRFADAFAAEADGLSALHSAGVRVPALLSRGIAGRQAYLMLEHLALREQGDFAALGAMVAAMHRVAGSRFGWHRDNYIGATPQANRWCRDWGRFWLECRLQPQLELAMGHGYRIDAAPAFASLTGHQPVPVLLHGDLWRGNAGFSAEGPVLFDPAVYYGDRETDLAMTELFGGFPDEFYAGYRAAFPLEPGYELRKTVYNLYHLLNHLNLFGSGYLSQVEASLRLLRQAL